ncbi:MAG TPA: amino acid adenylation domain-containing protein [Candidatus Angelobacter sp.]|nr:amino acid adenylation domain-containing protein [Candidatus Angelobacter sp.]
MAVETETIQERIAGLSAEKRALVEKLLKGSSKTVPPRIGKRQSSGQAPLSFAQQRLWFFEQLLPGTPVYNMHMEPRFPAVFDPSVLERSLNEMVRRHEILRTSFATVDGKPVQIVSQELKVELPVVDLRHLPLAEREAELARLSANAWLAPFDLATAPLLRAQLLWTSQEEFTLLLTIHHIICDAWSVNIFFRELGILCSAFHADAPSPLPEPPIQYADYAVWQRNWLQGELLERQLSHWKQRLEGIAPFNLPTDRPRPATPSFRGALLPVRIGGDLLAKLRMLSKRRECTNFMTLLAAFQVLLFRYSGQEDVVVGTPVANRNYTEIEEVMGVFINSLVMRATLAGDLPFNRALAQVRETALEAYANQDIPFEMLVEQLQPERDFTRNPLFQVMFQLQTMNGSAPEESGNTGGVARHNAIFDVNVNLFELSDAIIGGFEYNADLFDEATAAQMVAHWNVLLQAIVENPGGNLGDLAILTEEERAKLFAEWKGFDHAYPENRTIHSLFEEAAGRMPHAIAVAGPDQTLTYDALNRKANQLAWRLRELGVRRGDRAGICLDRSAEMLVAIFATLKLGAAYVPLDPESPPERLKAVVDDAAVALVVTHENMLEHFSEPGVRMLALDREVAVIAENPDHSPPANEAGGADIAYVVYTSGSTGKPKGVCVPHQSLVNSTWARLHYYRDPVARYLLLSPFVFDSSVAGIFWALCTGGSLHVPSRNVLTDPAQLAVEIARDKITHFLTIPSLYSQLLDHLRSKVELAGVIVAGEPCPLMLVQRHFERFPEVALFNEYGPTEATVWATVFRCGREGNYSSLPIGRPVANTRTYIVDGDGRPVPVGVPGELWIGGDNVSHGYWNRPDLTAERFLPDPFHGSGARVYRTGDKARYLRDSNIEFLGRIDQQIKIRGFRIELGEIEAVLQRHPGIEECAAFAWKHEEDFRLAAWLVARADEVETDELVSFLEQYLPAYMIPSSFTWVLALPRNANGKLDRGALVADSRQSKGRAKFVAPRTTVEETVAGLYTEVLGVEQPGVNDNFFQLGGHSLLATQLLSRVNKTFQLQLPLPAMFESPTVASLAQLVEESLFNEISALPDSEPETWAGPQQAG